MKTDGLVVSVLYCTVAGSVCTILYFTALYLVVSVLYCTVLYCTILYYTVLYCTVLYCTAAEPRLLGAVLGAADHLLGHARHVLPLRLPHGRGRDPCGLLELLGGHHAVAGVTGCIACIFTF